MRKWMLLMAVVLLTACSKSEHSALDGELDAFRAEANAQAKLSCGAHDSDISDSNDETNELARCYYELAVDFTPCERKALNAHASDARALLACFRRDQQQLLTCCAREAPCSYSNIEGCYQELWSGATSGPCAADNDAIEAATTACQAGLPPEPPRADSCEGASFVPLGWNEASLFGKTPAQTFAPYAGSCSAAYRLNADPFPGVEISPRTSEGDLDIAITLDEASALLVTPADQNACSMQLAIRAQVQIETRDGLLHERFETVLRQQSYDQQLRLALRADAIEGSLQLHGATAGQLSLQFAVLAVGATCAGSLSIEFWGERDAHGASSGFGGPIGSWSSP